MAVARPHRTEPPAPSRVARIRSRLDGGRTPSERWLRVGLAALLVGTMTLSGPGEVRPTDARVAPACTTADVLTRYRTQADWYRSLLDTKYRISRTSAPRDLVSVSRSGASGYGYIRKLALADLTAMYRASSAYGAPFAVQSAYRSYASQVAVFNMWVRKIGYTRAKLASARPGHSEHQLGTALDLRTPGAPAPWYYADWGQTKAGAWLRRNSWRYGWVLSYPKVKSPGATCYKYEPWHFRYVGRTIAARIRNSTLAPREWLYLKGATTTWTGGLPYPTPTPKPTPAPTATPSPSPSDAPSATPSDAPTEVPTEGPSATPSEVPSAPPEDAPSATPSEEPSAPVAGVASKTPDPAAP